MPLQRTAEQSAWPAKLVDSGAIHQAMAWTPAETHRFLRAILIRSFAPSGPLEDVKLKRK